MSKRTIWQQRLPGFAVAEPRAFARLQRSLGPRLSPVLDAMRADFEALGQPSRNACELAAKLWTREQADRLSRYLKGLGHNTGRVTW